MKETPGAAAAATDVALGKKKKKGEKKAVTLFFIEFIFYILTIHLNCGCPLL